MCCALLPGAIGSGDGGQISIIFLRRRSASWSASCRFLFDAFGEATALATSAWKKQGRILKIILYDSHARAGWVDEPHTAKGYPSDFDLLIIVNHAKLTDRVEYWSAADDRLDRALAIEGGACARRSISLSAACRK